MFTNGWEKRRDRRRNRSAEPCRHHVVIDAIEEQSEPDPISASAVLEADTLDSTRGFRVESSVSASDTAEAEIRSGSL